MLRQLLSRIRRRHLVLDTHNTLPLDGELDGFSGTIEIVQAPGSWRATTPAKVRVLLRNTGQQAWPAAGLQPVFIGYHWRPAGAEQYMVHDDGHRSLLPVSIAPGTQRTVWCGVKRRALLESIISRWTCIAISPVGFAPGTRVAGARNGRRGTWR